MATIAEKSRTKEIIERLQGLLENASPVPFAAGKVSIYKDEVQTLLTELATQMDIEIKTYHEVNDRKGKIINEAKKEAEKIIFQAEHSASRMRVSKRTTSVTPIDYDSLDEEEIQSLGNANEIYAASLIYTDEMLSEITDVISNAYKNIRDDYEIMLQVLEDKLKLLNNNKEELMSGLQEMDTDDRSQQIMEIGQLLSNELYNERMKRKMSVEEYDDGSIQLTMDFQKMQEEQTRLAQERAMQAEQALLAAQAERDMLQAALEQMKKEEQRRQREADAAKLQTVLKETTSDAHVGQAESEAAVAEDEDVEYEVVYVTEDELEDGEEYEIEYVDEDELEEGEEYEVEYVYEDVKEPVKDVPQKQRGEDVQIPLIELDIQQQGMEENGAEKPLPLVPRFQKSQRIASAPSGKIAKMAKAVTTDEKYRGLIGNAAEKEMPPEKKGTPDDEKTVKIPTEEVKAKLAGKPQNSVQQKKPEKQTGDPKQKKTADTKTDADGKEYVEATMGFDEDYEIVEF